MPRRSVIEGPSIWAILFWDRSQDARTAQVLVTLPLLTAVAYAIGNKLAMRYKDRINRQKLNQT